jgi:hypothetical protein
MKNNIIKDKSFILLLKLSAPMNNFKTGKNL